MLRLASLAAVALACSAAFADPPRIVRMSPDHGDTGVDAATTEIRLEFDQDMSPGGRSICGGGPQFPKISGTPRWETPRVLVIPVTLEPEHEYRLSVNCPSARNFKSVNGEAAQITPLRFTTAKAGEKATAAAPLTPEANARAIAALRTAIDQRYSYRDRVVKDWDALIAKHNEALLAATTRAQFARELARLMGAAQDVHVSVRVGETGFPTFSSATEGNIDYNRMPSLIKEFRWRNQVVASGRAADGVGYILIATWPGDPNAVKAAHEALDEMIDVPAMIIDVRSNGGGDESTARIFAGRFVKERAVYSRNRFRDPGAEGGWGRVFDRVVTPQDAKGAKPYAGKAAVLIGPGCVSSNESFILMMREGARAPLIGGTTRGSSGNPRRHDLGNGVTVSLPSWEDLFPDGSAFEGIGIAPTIKADLRRAPEDGVLAEAIRVLTDGT